MTGRRAQLQSATADIHEALHGAEPFARIANGAMDRRGYVVLLQMLFRYHAAMESLSGAGAAHLDLAMLAAAQQDRLSALRHDLAVLDATVPRAAPLPPRGGDFAVGCLYTVLGSTLGGKVLHRQLDALLPNDDGRRFFRGGPDDGANWRLFCQGLEAAPIDDAQMQAGARFAFARFQAMLEEETATT